MNNLINEYRKLLREQPEHISDSVLSTYINFFPELSSAEQRYIRKHLVQCEECRTRYERVFDEEFEFDKAVKNIELPRDDSSGDDTLDWNYRSSDHIVGIQLDWSPVSAYQLIFIQLSIDLSGASVRITIPETELTFRIVSAEPGESYEFPSVSTAISQPPNHLEVEWLTRNFEPTSAEAHDKPASAWRWYVAAAAILLTLSASLFFLLDRPNYIAESESLTSTTEGTHQAFAPHPVLENFINRRLRGNTSIEMLSPGISDTAQSPITFRWKSSAQYYRITILSNRNERLWNAQVEKPEATFVGDLSPGLYYWKVSSGNTVLGVGKFIVN